MVSASVLLRVGLLAILGMGTIIRATGRGRGWGHLANTIGRCNTGYNAYTYDLVGNRKSDVLSGSEDGTAGTTTYSYNSDNELTSQTVGSTTTTFTFDNNGSQLTSTTGSNVTTNTYNVRNELNSVATGGSTTTYVYNDAGNLVQETTSGTTTYYLVDDNNPTGYAKPIEVRVGSASGTPTTTYILGDRVIGQANSSGAVSYLLTDGEDNTRALVSSSGTITAAYNYDPFGDPIGFSLSTASTRLLFQQTMFDAPSGLNIFGDGQREAEVGEDNFIEADSPGYSDNVDPLTLNGYLLDGANPISNVDPSGHDLTDILVSLGLSETIASATSGFAIRAAIGGATNVAIQWTLTATLTPNQYTVQQGIYDFLTGGLTAGASNALMAPLKSILGGLGLSEAFQILGSVSGGWITAAIGDTISYVGRSELFSHETPSDKEIAEAFAFSLVGNAIGGTASSAIQSQFADSARGSPRACFNSVQSV